MKKFVYIYSFALSLFVSALASASDMNNPENMQRSVNLAKAAYMSAVGGVAIKTQAPCGHADCCDISGGTGTFIGSNLVLTAAHLFTELLPKSVVKKTGPVEVIFKPGSAYWTSAADPFNPEKKDVKIYASSFVVDASAIHSGLPRGKKDLAEREVQADIALVRLVSSPLLSNIQPIPVFNSVMNKPQLCLSIGYGKLRHHKYDNRRHVIFHKPFYNNAVHGSQNASLFSNCEDQSIAQKVFNNAALKRTAEVLLGKPNISKKDILVAQCTGGDSGGPLISVGGDGKPYVMGVVSASSVEQNCFASLIEKLSNGSQYKLSKLMIPLAGNDNIFANNNYSVEFSSNANGELVTKVFDKGHYFGQLPLGFNVRAYLHLNPDVNNAAAENKLDPIGFGAYHYLNWGKNEGRKAAVVPKGFRPWLYLLLHADVKNAAVKNSREHEEFAAFHYLAYGAKEGRVSAIVPVDFCPFSYINLYQDLIRAVANQNHDPYNFGFMHYVEWGQKEGRAYK